MLENDYYALAASSWVVGTVVDMRDTIPDWVKRRWCILLHNGLFYLSVVFYVEGTWELV